MPSRRAVVFGGSGFLGRRAVAALEDDGIDAVASTRHPHGDGIAADVTDQASVERAVAGAAVVVNSVALYVETANASFHDVHVRGARNVAMAASEAGAEVLVHISGIGADTDSPSAYVRARAEGETAVREAFPDAIILRPSVMFGPDDSFLNGLAGVVARAPVVPLFGTGATRLQPVFVGDVAAAVAAAARRPAARGAVYELGGPEVLTYREILHRVMQWTGHRRPLLPFPWLGWSLLVRAARLLPSPPLTEAQVALMRHDNIAAPDTRGLGDLDVTPTAMSAIAPGYLTG